MKLLFDHNISPRLVARLSDLYPQSNHVYLIGLDQASDEVVWQYARENEFIIVTKDLDYNELVILRGFPPKVVWIRLGNCTTCQIEALLRLHNEDIKVLSEDLNLGLLTLS